MSPIVRAFFDRPTGSLQYVFHCPKTKTAAIVDPVWNFYPEAGAVTTESADEILAYVENEALEVAWVLDTHPHADHFSAAPYLSARLGAPTAIGEKVTGVQKLWKDLYHLGADFPTDGSQWDHPFAEGDEFMVGEIAVRVMFSPGHTLGALQVNIRGGRLPEAEAGQDGRGAERPQAGVVLAADGARCAGCDDRASGARA